jgi:excisionase family DNA binding protein
MAVEVKPGMKLYTVQEAADMLQVTPQTIRVWIKQKRLKAGRLGRPFFVSQKAIDQFLSKFNN